MNCYLKYLTNLIELTFWSWRKHPVLCMVQVSIPERRNLCPFLYVKTCCGVFRYFCLSFLRVWMKKKISYFIYVISNMLKYDTNTIVIHIFIMLISRAVFIWYQMKWNSVSDACVFKGPFIWKHARGIKSVRLCIRRVFMLLS